MKIFSGGGSFFFELCWTREPVRLVCVPSSAGEKKLRQKGGAL
jgi:hypothetical protein